MERRLAFLSWNILEAIKPDCVRPWTGKAFIAELLVVIVALSHPIKRLGPCVSYQRKLVGLKELSWQQAKAAGASPPPGKNVRWSLSPLFNRAEAPVMRSLSVSPDCAWACPHHRDTRPIRAAGRGQEAGGTKFTDARCHFPLTGCGETLLRASAVWRPRA